MRRSTVRGPTAHRSREGAPWIDCLKSWGACPVSLHVLGSDRPARVLSVRDLVMGPMSPWVATSLRPVDRAIDHPCTAPGLKAAA